MENKICASINFDGITWKLRSNNKDYSYFNCPNKYFSKCPGMLRVGRFIEIITPHNRRCKMYQSRLNSKDSMGSIQDQCINSIEKSSNKIGDYEFSESCCLSIERSSKVEILKENIEFGMISDGNNIGEIDLDGFGINKKTVTNLTKIVKIQSKVLQSVFDEKFNLSKKQKKVINKILKT